MPIKKLTLEDCIEEAKNRNGKCLSKVYINNHTKMKWQCKENHVWESNFSSIRNQKTWCPVCASLKKSYELSGKRFGRWKVIKRQKYDVYGNVMWECLCDCGTKRLIRAYSLVRGVTKSCGCSIKRPKGESAFISWLNSYRTRCKIDKIEFNLSIEKFRELVSKNCHYCGKEPQKLAKRSKTQNGTIYVNGIDRVNNNKGYLIDNVVTCCKWCNRMKSNYPLEEFKEHIKQIYEHLKLDEKESK